MYWHIDTDIVSLIVIAAMYIYNVGTLPKDEYDDRTRGFHWCLRIGIAVTIIDIAASIVMETAVSRLTYHLLMTLYMTAIELVIVAWFIYAIAILYEDDERRRKRANTLVLIPYALYALVTLTNPWTGVIYTLGWDNEYARGEYFYLMVALYAAYTLALFIVIFSRRKHIMAGYSAAVLLTIPLILGVSIAVQLLNPGWLMIMPGYMISMVAAFLFLQTKRVHDSQTLVKNLSTAAMTDQLTGLYNRAGMEHMVELLESSNIGKRCMVCVADVDELKTINDALGHPEGDNALKAVGAQLKNHFRATDLVARFGGDEFVVYLIGNLSELQAYRNLKRLTEELASIRVGEDGQFPVHGSVGAAFGTVGSDSFGELCGHADTALYYVKQHGKSGCALYAPAMDETVFESEQEEAEVLDRGS